MIKTRSSREDFAVLLVFALLFTIAVFPVAVGWRVSEASFDETRCYLPAITQMRANFPAVDILRDSLSASPPGYTHLLAALSFIGGDTLPAHRAWHVFISLVGAIALLWFVARLAPDPSMVIPAMLPAVCSGYYLKAAAQLTTDNPAFLLTVAVTALAVFGITSCRHAVLAGFLGVAATYVRHVAVWTAAPIFAKGLVVWLAGQRCAPASGRVVFAWLAASFAVVLTLVVFLWSWGGVVPPAWTRQAQGALSLTPLAYGLLLCCLFAPFFLGAAALAHALTFSWEDVLLGSMAGLAIFLLSETVPNYEAGRWGGPIWALAGKLPTWEGRALFFLPGTMLGGVWLAIAVRSLFVRVPNQAFIWSAAFAAWMLTTIPNRQVFHRYYEGPILAFLGLWLIALCCSLRGPSCGAAKAVVYALSSMLFMSGVYSLFTSPTGFSAPLSGQ